MEEIHLYQLILTTKLYDETIKGDLNSLHTLLQEDPLILDRRIIEKSDHFMQSPLHVAANLGHLEFTTEILRLKPELAMQLDQLTRSSALHLASEKGHLDVVKILYEVNPNMCLVRDQDRRNPFHIAAINNQLHVLDFLVLVNPYAAQERTAVGETLLHLCVKYAQLDPLKYCVNVIGELLNAKDNNGNTVLHLAVLAKQSEAVKFLATNNKNKLQQNEINKNGFTEIDCLIQDGKNLNDKEIRRTLEQAKVTNSNHADKQRNKDRKWLKKQHNTLMVVASPIATMAFQVGVNPPLGVVENHSTPDLRHGISPHIGILTHTDRVQALMIVNIYRKFGIIVKCSIVTHKRPSLQKIICELFL